MKILVVGGAGYIGSHMVKRFGQLGVDVVTLDNLVGGYRDAITHGEFVEGDIADRSLLDRLFSAHQFDVVMHFASYIEVGESVRDPAKYYQNNVANTLTLLEAMKDHGVLKFIFSSTAATFGEPQYVPIDESHPQSPINPYGQSKLMIEKILADFDQAYGMKSVCLRYFNAAGADPECIIGERHEPETHLVPLILQAASGRREAISVFGRDYDTDDGTCVRDYIHVMDLAEAHWLGVQRLVDGGDSASFNLGNGQGFSVQAVIDAAKRVTGRDIQVIDAPRRDGDPARLVADSTAARQQLGWQPQYADLDTIIKHAWDWELKHFN